MKKNIILHPWLLAIIPILALFENNQDIAILYYLSAPVIVALVSSIVLFFIINFFVKNSIKSALIVSTVAISFFFFDTLSIMFFEINDFLSYGATIYESLAFIAYLILMFAIAMLIHSSKKDLIKLNQLVNFFAVVIVLMQIVGIVNYQLKHSTGDIDFNYNDNIQKVSTGTQDLPDIYYIILDAYGREDMLNDLYGYDNSQFINYLKDKGFYVADKSYSNYNQTFLSMGSALNLNYLDEVAKEVGYESDDRNVLMKILKNNEVQKILKEQGYTFATVPSTWIGTYRNQASDIYLSSGLEYNNSFNSIVIKKTPLLLFFPNMRVEGSAKFVNATLDTIPKIADIEESTFSYIHILSPHPPFIFEADGSIINTVLNCMEGTDGSKYLKVCPGQEKYREQYVEQLTYINQRVEKMIDEILAKSDKSPIIILQGDHGPGSMLDWASLENSNIEERFSILNAYFVPEEIKEKLYTNISPVNSFRLLLNYLFDDNFETLEDRSYFAIWDQPYNFLDVTDSLNK